MFGCDQSFPRFSNNMQHKEYEKVLSEFQILKDEHNKLQYAYHNLQKEQKQSTNHNKKEGEDSLLSHSDLATLEQFNQIKKQMEKEKNNLSQKLESSQKYCEEQQLICKELQSSLENLTNRYEKERVLCLYFA